MDTDTAVLEIKYMTSWQWGQRVIFNYSGTRNIDSVIKNSWNKIENTEVVLTKYSQWIKTKSYMHKLERLF